MRFAELVDKIADARVIAPVEREIEGITYDSREVRPGWLFVAMRGGSHDGHGFIPAAIEAGAAAVLVEREVEGLPAGVGCAIVPDGRTAMGQAAAPFFDYPSRKLKLIGVTGTSGKTTVTHLVKSIFSASGVDAGLIGTLGFRIGERLLSTKHTTPESVDIQRILAQMADEGVKAVAIEASSHGLYQGRTLGCEFDCGIFTNIARDHLDFHGTVEAYLDAKLILFRDYPQMSDKPFRAVINADDPAASIVAAASAGPVTTFAVENPADLTATAIEVTDSDVRFDLHYAGETVPICLNIGGFFNVYNALSAAAAAVALGMDLGTVSRGLTQARSVPGRFESVDCGQEFGVIVDYAHTPDELENVLKTARDLSRGRLIAVFGCGGDRDRGKRPIMGRIGSEIADVVVVTSDNPRTEHPLSIIDQVRSGIASDARAEVMVEPDRRGAIRSAIMMAQPGDLIVVAGKGHEDYQIFANGTIHFDDREVARELLAEIHGCSPSK